MESRILPCKVVYFKTLRHVYVKMYEDAIHVVEVYMNRQSTERGRVSATYFTTFP